MKFRQVQFFELLFGLALLGGACSDDKNATSSESQTLLSFDAGDCKKDALQDDTYSLFSLYTNRLYTDHGIENLDGLQCVSWEETNGALSVDLINFNDACGVQMNGRSEIEASTAYLILENAGCDVANCGWCTYDWSFQIDSSVIVGDLELQISVDDYPQVTCPDVHDPANVDHYSVAISEDERESGIVCKLQHYYALEDYAMTIGSAGQLRMPCAEEVIADTESARCQEGLVCLADPSNDTYERCLASCTGDDDCAPTTIFHCDQGICQLSNPW